MPAARLALLFLHQRSASLDARERLTVLASAAPARPDLIALLTCHRVELYAAVEPEADPREAFSERLGIGDAVPGEAGLLLDAAAAAHLFRVALGLDSAIVGEGQIAGQIRRAYEASRTRGVDPILATLFQRALHLARTVRATTELGTVRRSIGSLAVDEGLCLVADPARATVLVVGAGEVGKLAARALARRVGRVLIVNRDVSRATELAVQIGTEAIGLEGLPGAIDRADLVISAADTRGALLTPDVLGPRAARRPLVLIDIAVPRSVAEDARELPGILYRDVDHVATGASGVPEATVAEAEQRCRAAAADYVSWLQERESSDTIRAVRERADAIRARQLARALRRLGHLSERDRDVVEALATSLTHALLHEPTVRLRGRPDHDRAARDLFGIGT